MESRKRYLASISEHSESLPGTSLEEISKLPSLFVRVCALDFADSLRRSDELLIALFPYISDDILNIERLTFIQDESLREFLMGTLDIPRDPDSTIKKISRFISSRTYTYTRTRGYTMQETPEDSKNFKALQERLATLRKAFPTKTKVKAKARSRKPAAAAAAAAAAVVVAEATPRVKSKPAPHEAVDAPAGGWSSHDKARATAAAQKNLTYAAVVKEDKSSEEGYVFKPIAPIVISHKNNETRQALLNPETPEFSISYDDVISLFGDLGIAVETRGGGSHMHINTPGRNMKILVRPHGGFTDNYNKTTMGTLRELLINIGTADESNMRVGKREGC